MEKKTVVLEPFQKKISFLYFYDNKHGSMINQNNSIKYDN